MNAVILSTAYLPPVDYFFHLFSGREVFIEAHENYSRQTFRNRCVIFGPNGPQRLTVPVIHPRAGAEGIGEIRIDYSVPWQRNHWRSLEAAYNKSPFFMYYCDEFEKFFHRRETLLFDFNRALLDCCLGLLKWDQKPGYTTVYQKEIADACDLREKSKYRKEMPGIGFPRYSQVFEPVHGFIPGLSIADLLFNLGNQSRDYILNLRTVV